MNREILGRQRGFRVFRASFRMGGRWRLLRRLSFGFFPSTSTLFLGHHLDVDAMRSYDLHHTHVFGNRYTCLSTSTLCIYLVDTSLSAHRSPNVAL